MKIGVLITVYNEGPRIDKILKKLSKYHVIVVNDGSTDDTLLKVKKYKNVESITYSKNRGKGYALQRGLVRARKLKFDILIALDYALKYTCFVQNYQKSNMIVFSLF